MNLLDANIRDTKTKGDLSALRNNGSVPAIIYGGEAQNEKVSISSLMGEAIKRISNSTSVSDLFK